MAHTITIPTLLRSLTGGLETVELEAATVLEVVENLDAQYPGFRARICETNGELRRFINFYLNGEDVRFLDNLATRLPEQAEIAIIPAIAGG
ncbi:MAG: MoaD/ThiS family protein [Blastocatellia bacterium]|nr:MoaD/ThiS family protein [Blastocatellia bacterium]